MGMIPGKEVDGGLLTQMAEDGLASLAYAVRCLLVDEPQEAEWAVGREYDATDHAAIKLTGLRCRTPKKEAKLLAHPLIQRALGRQQRRPETAAERRFCGAAAPGGGEPDLHRTGADAGFSSVK
jgi:hypothetical protein